MTKNNKKAIIEAILFSLGEAVQVSRLAEEIGEDVKSTRKLIAEMIEDMKSAGRGVTIVELDDAFQMCSKPEMYEYLIDITKTAHKNTLSDSALEALSIIAYKQPVTRLDVEKIRGVNSDYAINRLLEFELIKELGRLDAPGKPILFGTTEQFLRSFGVKSLDELPEISASLVEEFKEQAEAEVQIKLDI
jgi:segregation and condensation protein B